MPPKKEEPPEQDEEAQAEEDIQMLLDEEPDRLSITPKRVKRFRVLKYLRIGLLLIIWLITTGILFFTHESEGVKRGISVLPTPAGAESSIDLKNEDSVTIHLYGAFAFILDNKFGTEMVPSPNFLADGVQSILYVSLRRRSTTQDGQEKVETVGEQWHLALGGQKDFETKMQVARKKKFEIGDTRNDDGSYFVHFYAENILVPLPLLIEVFPGMIDTRTSNFLSVVVVVGFMMFLFWDVTSRATIGLIFSNLSIALMGIYHIRPYLRHIAEYVIIDYALLLIGLTIIVGVFAETGGDRFLAVHVIRFSKGHVWPMLTVFCLIAAVGAAFLDQLTILVLITLLAIRVCELQQLNPSSFLTCVIIFSNIGYMLTPTGLIGQAVLYNPEKKFDDSTYLHSYVMFVVQMFVPVSCAMLITYCFLRLYYRSTKSMQNIEPPLVTRIKHAIRFWNHTAKSLGDYSEVEKAVQQSVRQKVNRLRSRLKRLGKMPTPTENFDDTIKRLEDKYKLMNKPIAISTLVIISLVIVVQILYDFNIHHLSNGWACLLFSLLLLAVANMHDFESLMKKIDWSTLLMIASIMIITKAITPLGFLDEISDLVVNQVGDMQGNTRLYLGVVILVSVSAVGSAFFDTEYVCKSMAGSVVNLAQVLKKDLTVEPLLLSIIMGAGFGCNITLISAFSNVVCAGLAEKHDYKFYFWDFFKVGASITLLNLVFSIIYIFVYSAIITTYM